MLANNDEAFFNFKIAVIYTRNERVVFEKALFEKHRFSYGLKKKLKPWFYKIFGISNLKSFNP